jgi:hypothetical protein
MKQKIANRFYDKREGMVYVTVLLWVLMGVLAAFYAAPFDSVAVYYLSLTAFVGSFIWGESVRQSKETSIFFKGKSSRREIMLYVVMTLWLALGIYGIVGGHDIVSMSSYFAALSPFVSAYVLGETYKPINPADLKIGGSTTKSTVKSETKKLEVDDDTPENSKPVTPDDK